MLPPAPGINEPIAYLIRLKSSLAHHPLLVFLSWIRIVGVFIEPLFEKVRCFLWYVTSSLTDVDESSRTVAHDGSALNVAISCAAVVMMAHIISTRTAGSVRRYRGVSLVVVVMMVSVL